MRGIFDRKNALMHGIVGNVRNRASSINRTLLARVE